jgi:hypothetical protein
MLVILARELETYRIHKAELLGRANGKFVLIVGERIIDVFESPGDAVKRGHEEVGNEPFLVRQVQEVEVPLNYTSHLIQT